MKTIYDHNSLLASVGSLNIGVLLKVSGKRSGGYGLRRSAPYLPTLQGSHADRQSGDSKNANRLRLTELVKCAPADKLLNHGGQAFPRCARDFGRGGVLQIWLSLEEFGQCRSTEGMRPCTPYFPVLQSAEFNGEAGVFQDSHCL
jgi:hypothetical protein